MNFAQHAETLANLQGELLFQAASTVLGTNTVPVGSYKLLEQLHNRTLSTGWDWGN